MSSKVFNWSDDYDYKKQRKCTVCGIVYNLTPEYGYDSWNSGHYGCKGPRQRITGYKDKGCPYCKEKEVKRKKQILEYEQSRLAQCQKCHNTRISSNKFEGEWYQVECDCVKMNAHTKKIENVHKLVGKWNDFYSKR